MNRSPGLPGIVVGEVDRAGDEQRALASGIEMNGCSLADDGLVDMDGTTGRRETAAAEIGGAGETECVVGVAADRQIGAQRRVEPGHPDRVGAAAVWPTDLNRQRDARIGERHRRTFGGDDHRQIISCTGIVRESDGLGSRGEVENPVLDEHLVRQGLQAGVGDRRRGRFWGGAGVTRPDQAVADTLHGMGQRPNRPGKRSALDHQTVTATVGVPHAVEHDSSVGQRVAAGEVDDQRVVVAGAVDRDVGGLSRPCGIHRAAVDGNLQIVSLANHVERVRHAVVRAEPGIQGQPLRIVKPSHWRTVEHATFFQLPNEQIGKEFLAAVTGRTLRQTPRSGSHQLFNPVQESHSINSPLPGNRRGCGMTTMPHHGRQRSSAGSRRRKPRGLSHLVEGSPLDPSIFTSSTVRCQLKSLWFFGRLGVLSEFGALHGSGRGDRMHGRATARPCIAVPSVGQNHTIVGVHPISHAG